MDAWEFSDLEAARAASGRLYHEFKRVPDLSAGNYTLEAGATDSQRPHTEDAETRPVVPGTVVFVPAAVPHRFHAIAERFELLVMFGPAEGDRAGG